LAQSGIFGVFMLSFIRGISKEISLFLWLMLWVTTLNHAGLTLWAMLSTANLPPDCQIPPGWFKFLPPGPDTQTYQFYLVALTANILWESWFKGSKTYVRSSFPFPDILYSYIAFIFWSLLWFFGKIGHSNGWFPFPARLDNTAADCIFLFMAQSLYLDARRKAKESEEELDEPEPDEAGDVPPPVPTPVKTEGKEPEPRKKAPVPPAPEPLDSGDSESTRKVLEHIRRNGQAKTGALAAVVGSPRRTVIRNLNKLLTDGRLVREGRGPGAVYKLKPGSKNEG